DLRVDLKLPEHLESLALRIVVEAGHGDERGLTRLRRRLHVLNEVLTLAEKIAPGDHDVEGRLLDEYLRRRMAAIRARQMITTRAIIRAGADMGSIRSSFVDHPPRARRTYTG